MRPRALRGRLLSFRGDPDEIGDAAVFFEEDGVLVIQDGRIAAVGAYGAVDIPVDPIWTDLRPWLLTPGFIDAHLHFPQTQVIASYGAELLDWLERYTFRAELRYGDPDHVARCARVFIDELLRNGTTTAVVYGSVHPQSIDGLFAEAERRGVRLIAGKSMMDRNAPDGLRDTAQSSYDESAALIDRWHGRGRAAYAVTPRFAITSTPAQLDAAGALLKAHPSCYLQTHLSENAAEIATVRELFPDAASYTDVYARAGLLGPRSLFGHCIHLDDGEWRLLSESGSIAVTCPTSNAFLGSGLFDFAKAQAAERPTRVAAGTDIGGGTSYSMLRTLAAAYDAQRLLGGTLTPQAAFHLATRGGAAALSLDGRIGVFEPGADADVVALNSRATPAMAHRMETVETLEEELFVLLTLGDDRAIRRTFAMGEDRSAG
ncbi:MAG: guanine deaminase [Pseudomonadota bacterium]